ncbi:hypothetical protein BD410DRAFT_808842 [Rickenella mellea]|uniref:Uncharacterized protein n=1 Tax=Rickenella mellea TaxID=50990 RepID=A0A4Y7PJB4_9AGAM|nr:hypothetical protein BD410DRAFT_808842 [Rickenella mellea]
MGRRRIKSPYQNEESFEGNKEEERAHLDRNVSGRGNPTRLVYDANGFLTFLVEDPEWGDRAGDDWVEVRRSGRLIGRKASTKDIYVHRLVWIGVKGSQMICADPKRMNIAIGCVRVSKGDEVTKSDWKGRGRPSTNDAVSISVNLRSGLTEDHRGCFEKESPSIPKGGSGDVDPCDLVNRAMTRVTIMRQTTQYKSVKLRTYSTAKTEETNNGYDSYYNRFTVALAGRPCPEFEPIDGKLLPFPVFIERFELHKMYKFIVEITLDDKILVATPRRGVVT